MIKNRIHILKYSPSDISSVFSDPAHQEIIKTPAFRRLKSIHFLGSIDFIINPSRKGVEVRHTRYDHSLAVGSLALQLAKSLGVTDEETRLIVAAALLHDIGHAPLSHSLEPALKSFFYVDHHRVGERILRGEVRLGLKLASTLSRWGMSNIEIMCLISGVGSGFGKEVFSRAINVDTVEGITRSAMYLYRRGLTVSPVEVIEAFSKIGPDSEKILDEFWMLKDEVYSRIIQSWMGLMADLLCKRYVEKNFSMFNESYYYGTEKELRDQHSELFEALWNLGERRMVSPKLVSDGEEISFSKRSFYIDKSIRLKTHKDVDRRYLQRKDRVTLTIRKRGGEDAHELKKYSKCDSLF